MFFIFSRYKFCQATPCPTAFEIFIVLTQEFVRDVAGSTGQILDAAWMI
jgi:hypothetical protein